MRILVTGGAGFIASHITDAYIKDGHDVVIADDLSSGKKEFINPKARFYEVDIRKKQEIETIIKKEKPEVINHHAAQISVRNSVADPFFDLEVNVVGLLNILSAAKEAGTKRIIFASSGGVVYGETDTLPTPETYVPLKPGSPYGISKLTSEYYLNYFCENYNMPFIALRYANVYGPRQNPHGEAGVVAIFTLKLLKNEVPVINGDGLQTRDYIYVGDVVSANRKALNPSQKGAFNIGTGKETNVVAIFDNLKRLTGKNISAKFGPAKSGEQRRSCLACDLAGKKLDWRPEIDIVEGLGKTVDYFRSNE